ncbi:MAG: hypothetical protein NTW19_04170 [Planctomycetota bacterium]|nr:hypothetical protein [Planctomycetota bacterium]
MPSGSGAQLAPLPWNNVDQVTLRFSETVTVHQEDLSIRGSSGGSAGTTYNTSGFTTGTGPDGKFQATWTLGAPLGTDKILLSLADTVQDALGQHLDGEWTNPAAISTPSGGGSTFPSGDGTPGTPGTSGTLGSSPGAFRFRFNVAPGDANQNVGINVQDVILTRNQQGKSLPAGEPALPAGAMAALVIAGAPPTASEALVIAGMPAAGTSDVPASGYLSAHTPAPAEEVRRMTPTRWSLNTVDLDSDADSSLLRKLQRRHRLTVASAAEIAAPVADKPG